LFEWDEIAMSPPLSPNDQPTLTPEHAEEAFCLTLSRGTYWVGTGNRNLTLSEFHKWRTDLRSTAFHAPQRLGFLANEDSRFSKLGISSWRNYTLARTKGGLLVMGIGSLKEGDEIALLKGCELPLIVRRSDVPGRFKLVGAAYVHGIMDGQRWDERRCQPMDFA
jgi:hypothetical protein